MWADPLAAGKARRAAELGELQIIINVPVAVGDNAEDLLERARRTLVPGGAVLVVEMVPNDDRVSPPFPAMFAFVIACDKV